MNNEKVIVLNFLKKYGMDINSIDIEANCKAFIKDMENGLESNREKHRMIPAYLTMEGEIPEVEQVIVLDAGGTNFRVAVVHFDKKKLPVIQDYRTYPIPGAKSEISRDEFYRNILSYISPVLHKSNKIGFCFSYHTEILPNKDGRLLMLSKELQVKGLVGDLIGENLLKRINELGYGEDRKIVMLNDTVATLLGGRAAYPDRMFDSYIGFILGTGTNCCYIEESRNIKKAADVLDKDGSMIINVESGDYEAIGRSVLDVELDNETLDKGEHIFEKMISGRYQGSLVYVAIKKAINENLFSHHFTHEFNKIDALNSQEIDEFLYYPYSNGRLSQCCKSISGGRIDDHLLLYHLIDSIVERSAKLVTVCISSIIIKTGKGKNPCKPVCITAEGTTFYKSKLFRSKLEYYIKRYLNEEKELYCEFVKADNATLVGTAIAALLN